MRVLKKNYDQTLAIETSAGTATLGAPAAEKVWIKLRTSGKKRT